jgi:hypothetical protein
MDGQDRLSDLIERAEITHDLGGGGAMRLYFYESIAIRTPPRQSK